MNVEVVYETAVLPYESYLDAAKWFFENCCQIACIKCRKLYPAYKVKLGESGACCGVCGEDAVFPMHPAIVPFSECIWYKPVEELERFYTLGFKKNIYDFTITE
jgi:hypothetical protein